MHERINRACAPCGQYTASEACFPEAFEPVNLPPQSMPAAGGASAFFSAMMGIFVSGGRCVRCEGPEEISGMDGTNGAYDA